MNSQDKRYEVVEKRSGDRFGNHTYAEACARARIMCRNWNYKKTFVVEELLDQAALDRMSFDEIADAIEGKR